MLASASNRLTNLQQELLQLYARNVSDDDLRAIHALIGQYFAQRLSKLADEAWEREGWSAQTMQDLLNDPNQ